jgi:ankyrin repeat protein
MICFIIFLMPHETEFIDVAKSGDTATVISLLDVDPDLVNAGDEFDKTALHWAAEKNDAVTAAVLVEAGADIGAKTKWGATPLAWAAVMGSNAVGDLLLEKDPQALTLIIAASLGKLPEVIKIVGSGADLSLHARDLTTREPDVEWPADTAYRRGDVVSDALYSAARNGHVETVRYLLDHGADIDARGFFGATGLHWAAMNGHKEMAEFLAERGAALTITDAKFDGTPADWAFEGGFSSIAEMLRLKDMGVNDNADQS